MSAGYIVARENFKEAARHVSAEADPVMFNLLYGLQSLTNQIEADFAALRSGAAPAGRSKAASTKRRSTPIKVVKKAAKKKPAAKKRKR